MENSPIVSVNVVHDPFLAVHESKGWDVGKIISGKISTMSAVRLSVEISTDATFEALKAVIAGKLNLPSDNLRLAIGYQRQPVSDSDTVGGHIDALSGAVVVVAELFDPDEVPVEEQVTHQRGEKICIRGTSSGRAQTVPGSTERMAGRPVDPDVVRAAFERRLQSSSSAH